MKFFIFLLFVGLNAAAMVKRDAEPEAKADAEADPHQYRKTGGDILYTYQKFRVQHVLLSGSYRGLGEPFRLLTPLIDIL